MAGRLDTAPGRPGSNEDGAVLLVGATVIVLLLVLAALVIDLGALRHDRRADRLVTDAASTAAVLELENSGGNVACATAFDYVIANTPEISSLSGQDCSTIPAVCDSGTAASSTTGTSGDYTVIVTFPVPDDHPLMTPSAIGGATQALSADDGARCERLGVEIKLARDAFFTAGTRTTKVHSVAKLDENPGTETAINVLLLERTDCGVGTANGQGQIIVDKVIDPAGVDLPGILAADSDATGCTPGGKLLATSGANSIMRADGPPGCDVELAGGPGWGCGKIQLLAPTRYTSGGTIAPIPEQLPERLTRFPVDERFNCLASYASEPWFSEQPISGCEKTRPAYIDGLTTFVGNKAPAALGFNDYETAGFPCSLGGSTPPVIVPPGNWFVGCNISMSGSSITFTGGNVVFADDVSVTGSGSLTVNACAAPAAYVPPAPIDCTTVPTALSWTTDTTFTYTDYSNKAAWAYFRDGDISKAGTAAVRFFDTMVYMTDGTEVSMSGGSGVLAWIAPREGPFDDLALWSEEDTKTQALSGQAALTLEGTFFAPLTQVTYTGNGAQKQVAAQFISETLKVSGNGALQVTPRFDRIVKFPSFSSVLIR